jgi:hypothetical protein
MASVLLYVDFFSIVFETDLISPSVEPETALLLADIKQAL